MRLIRAVSAELSKCLTLPGGRAGIAVAMLGSIALTVLNAMTARRALASGQPELIASASPFETAFAAMPLGTVGAVVLGVIAIGSEYTPNSPDAGGGRQIGTTLTALPQRIGLLSAKAVAVVLLVVGIAAVTLPVSIGVARLIVGEFAVESVSVAEAVVRCLGGTLYWTLTGLMALAITTLTRSATVPLIVLIMNNSLVSFSLLLTNLTSLAHWLPDLAGRRLFTGIDTVDGGLDAVPGAWVMAAWTVALLLVAGAVLRRRDA
ncbi:hypothetical protein [Micropruina sp.]|uniref:hypothetical protein n=1 Tax=Micropruina sp. TaxID=2737536 RepID=UPI00262FF46C|nr:hypothetical protein [Micropruina sp.]